MKWEKIWEYLGVALVIFTFVIPVIPWAGFTIYDEYFRTYTTTESESLAIPFEREEEKSYLEDVGYREVTTKGEEGILEVKYEVKTRNDSVVSREEITRFVSQEPVTEVTTVGMNEPEPEWEGGGYFVSDYNERSGAICWDGSYSSATGSGACSWHGGVQEWLY
jgi:hypothetical protein